MKILRARKPALVRHLVALSLSLTLLGCKTYSNLSDYKTELIHYYESGQYERDIAKAMKPAAAYITNRASQNNGNLAVVLDIDDTALSDWSFTDDMYLGYNKRAFEEWAQKGSAPPIRPVLEAYNTAKTTGIKVFFISNRKEHLRAATEQNLRTAGYANWDGLVMRPEVGPKQSVAEFKTQARQKLESQGIHIIANIGDQASDLVGGASERSFKIPNPFYIDGSALHSAQKPTAP
jgi:acid phosphatase